MAAIVRITNSQEGIGSYLEPLSPAPARFDELNAEARRLHWELLKNAIEITLTAVSLHQAHPDSPSLRLACQRTAQKGYQTVLKMLERVSAAEANTATLRTDLARLDRAMETLGIAPRGAQTLLVDQAGPDARSRRARSYPLDIEEARLHFRSESPTYEPEAVHPVRPGPATPEPLTPRELDVLKCIAKGYSTKETAHRLGMSFKTAACHRYRLMDKLDIHDVANLVRYAIRQGLVDV